MRIIEIHIYGYGKLENQSFTSLKDLQVFFGENEAGKTTIMSFIHSMFFGFPTKQQTDLRYEPKTHSKYGGNLHIESERYGRVIIERVKGKAIGDVTVTYADGRMGDEEDLKELLQGIDKSTYQAIYSFDLTGLQGLQKINEDDIGKFLLSAGMIGNDKLIEAEVSIQKELDSLFKPSGQKPLLNMMLKDLKDLQVQLKKAEESQKEYDTIQLELSAAEEKLEQLIEDITHTESQLTSYKEYLRIKPLLDQKEIVIDSLNQIGEIHFPADGMERLVEFRNMQKHFEAQAASSLQKQEDLKQKMEHYAPNKLVSDHENEIHTLLDKLPFLEQKELEIEQLQAQLRQHKSKKEDLLHEIHCSLTDQEIKSLNTSSFMKEKIKSLEEEWRKSIHFKEQLDERLKNEKELLEKIEIKISELKKQLLPMQERQDLENKRTLYTNFEESYIKKKLLEEQMEKVKEKSKKQKKMAVEKKKKENYFQLFLFLSLTILAVYSLVTKQYLLVGLSILIGIIFIGMRSVFKSSHSSNEIAEELKDLENKMQRLSETGNTRDGEWNNTLQMLLDKDINIQKQLEEETIKHQEQEETFNRVIDAFEKWEMNSKRLKIQIEAVLQELCLPNHISVNHLLVAFEVLTNAKSIIHSMEQIKTDLQEKADVVNGMKDELFYYTSMFGESTISWRDAAAIIKEKWNSNADRKSVWNGLNNRYEDIENEIIDCNRKIAFLQEEIEKLFVLSRSENEEEFRNAAKAKKEREQLLEQKKNIEVQLKNSHLSLENIKEYQKNQISEYTINNLENNRTIKKEEQTHLMKKIAEFKIMIKQIEEGGNYSDLLHRFYEKKSEFQEEAKEWAKYAFAKNLLQQTVNKFKTERLPKMLQHAENYLSYLTEGKYVKLHINSSKQGLMLQNHSGILYEANEVSRGTAEQAYVSIRLALALHTAENDSFPIIIDDSFVNFDKNRTEKMLQLLLQIKEKHQIIFFTCHEHLLNKFPFENTIFLKTEDVYLTKSQ